MTLTTAPAESFWDLWYWLCDIAANSRADSPLAIHSQSGDRQGWFQKTKEGHRVLLAGQVIRGMPFSASFTRRVDHELPRVLKDAVELLKPVSDCPTALRRVRRAQYRIVVAVLRDGRTDIEECRGVVRMAPFAFQVAATGGILALRSALNRE